MKDKESASRSQGPSIDASRYTLKEKIGEGGYGVVYKAIQLSTGQEVAIKFLKFKDLQSDEAKQKRLDRFERETQISSGVQHPNVVRLLDKGLTDDQVPYAVFEYVTGETLKDIILNQKQLSAEETAPLMEQVLDALGFIHSKGVIHRDLKPQNILITSTGAKKHAKILDFGIGTFSNNFQNVDYKTLTETGEVMGTPEYCAPELLSKGAASPESDLYSWGLILLECLTGLPVMQGETVGEVFQNQIDVTEVSMPQAVREHLLGRLLEKILQKDPQKRFHSASEVYEQFVKINFNSLVGQIKSPNVDVLHPDNVTKANQLIWRSGFSEKRLITVLCVKTSLTFQDPDSVDQETMETLEKEQMQYCKEIGVRYGAHITGFVADTIVMYFGYPQVHDNDARRAGRTALDLITRMKKQEQQLQKKNDVIAETRIAMNSGIALIQHKSIPKGQVPNTAFNLLYHAPNGKILVGESTKKLLDPYLEFEPYAIKGEISTSSRELQNVFVLTKERLAEALSNLSPRSALQKMIGRKAEQEKIQEVWKSMDQGNGRALLLQGQPGIGKSKLVYETKKWINEEGFEVRECRCLPEHQNNAFYPIFDMLKRAIPIQEGEESLAEGLEKVLEKVGCNPEEAMPVLCSWFSIPLKKTYDTVSSMDAAKQREILLETLEKWILGIDPAKKFMLVVEDLHWLDPSSLDFFTQLLNEQEGKTIFFLFTARPEFQNEWSSNQVLYLPLQALQAADSELLVGNILQNRSISENALKYIVERAEGVPLFIEDLTHMLLEKQGLTLVNDTYDLNKKFDTRSVPITLKGLLNVRLDRLGMAKDTAQIASVIGREFDVALLSAVVNKDPESLSRDLDQLLKVRFIYRQRNIGDELYFFRHALFHEAAYDSMTASNQKNIHLSIANLLVSEHPDRVEKYPFEVANHFGIGGEYETAVDYGIKAVERYVAYSLFKEAETFWKPIKTWVDEIVNTEIRDRKELEVNISMLPVISSLYAWGHEKSKKLVERNMEIIDRLEDINDESLMDSLLKSECTLFSHYHMTMMFEKAINLGSSLLKKLPKQKEKHHPMRMAITCHLGQVYQGIGSFEKALELFHQVCSEAEEHMKGEVMKEKVFKSYLEYGFDPLTASLGNAAIIFCILGDFEKALHNIELIKEILDKIQNSSMKDHSVLISMMGITFISLALATLKEKEKTGEIIDVLYEKYGAEIRKKDYFVERYLTIVDDWRMDKTDRAEKSLQGMINEGAHFGLSWYEVLLFEVLIKKGELDKAKRLINNSIERSENNGENYLFPMMYQYLGSISHSLNGISEEVEEYFLKAIIIAEQQKTSWLKFQATEELNKIYSSKTGVEPKSSKLRKLLQKFNEESNAYISYK